MAWINLFAPQALDIAKQMTLGPQAKALLAANPGASAGEFTEAMAGQNLNADAVGFLSHGMKPQAGVLWASESAAKVAPKLPPAELKAAELAKAWSQGQASPRQLDALLAQSPPQGPGTWAAQAASLAAKEPAAPGALAAPSALTSTAIGGSVHLAAAVDTNALQLAAPSVDGLPAVALERPVLKVPEPGMPAMTLPSQLTPPQLAEMNEALKPFVELGMKIAKGAPMTPAMSGLSTLPVV